jgi:nucleoside-diphosphate-sugar epimerase
MNAIEKKAKIAVTGATGFIGRHVIRYLKSQGDFNIVATGRNELFLRELNTDYVIYDLNGECTDCYETLGRPDILIHLAWEGLPDYQGLFHIERNLVNNYRFLKNMIVQGLPGLTVAGTCYEYGLQDGCLSEDFPTNPITSYGIAKDSLRRFLTVLQQQHPFRLQWARLFYLYGNGQNPRSLLAQLDGALEAGEPVFNMSGGKQLRDYLSVEDVACRLVKLAEHCSFDGVVNICSGSPISVLDLVKKHVDTRDASIHLNLGHYAYAEYEPMAFWGNANKQARLLDQNGMSASSPT